MSPDNSAPQPARQTPEPQPVSPPSDEVIVAAPGSVIAPSQAVAPSPPPMPPKPQSQVIAPQAPQSYSPRRARLSRVLLLVPILIFLAVLLTWLLTKSTTGQLNLNSRANKDTFLNSQSLTGNIGQQINMADGFSFKVTKIQTNFKPTYYAVPERDKQFVAVTVVGGNRLREGNLFYAPDALFKLKNSTNTLVTSDYDAYKGTGGTINTDLKPGQEKEETIVFQVKPNETPLSLVYSAKYGEPASASLSGTVKLK